MAWLIKKSGPSLFWRGKAKMAAANLGGEKFKLSTTIIIVFLMGFFVFLSVCSSTKTNFQASFMRLRYGECNKKLVLWYSLANEILVF